MGAPDTLGAHAQRGDDLIGVGHQVGGREPNELQAAGGAGGGEHDRQIAADRSGLRFRRRAHGVAVDDEVRRECLGHSVERRGGRSRIQQRHRVARPDRAKEGGEARRVVTA